MDLYFHPLSGCSRRVLALLGHLDLPFAPQLVQLAEGAQRQPAYLAKNPNGRVPTLVDGDLTLWESGAILRYLARNHRPALLGEDPRHEVEVDRWMAWTLTELSPALSRLNAETGLKQMRGVKPDPAAVAAAQAIVGPRLEILNTHLGESAYLAGSSPTLADFAAVPTLESAVLLARLALDDYPNIGSWMARAQALHGWPASLKVPT